MAAITQFMSKIIRVRVEILEHSPLIWDIHRIQEPEQAKEAAVILILTTMGFSHLTPDLEIILALTIQLA